MKVVETLSQTITRPNDTTAYASGDLVANSTTAGSVTPFQLYIPYGRGFKLWRTGINKSTATTTNAQFRVHFYKDSPTVANGDNGAFSSTSSNYLGFQDVDGTAPTFSNNFRAFGSATSITLYMVTDTDQLIYGLLEARAAYTPGAQETFSLVLMGEAYV